MEQYSNMILPPVSIPTTVTVQVVQRDIATVCCRIDCVLTSSVVVCKGGSSSRRRWRKAVSAGVNLTWPHCPYTACLSCGRASRKAPSCWTWKRPLCRRLSVSSTSFDSFPVPTKRKLTVSCYHRCRKLIVIITNEWHRLKMKISQVGLCWRNTNNNVFCI